ncbi:trafficking protein particle complex subunit 10 [Radiomyces spectabilis]|uniref:trafficking protein particle complex subunit 10 n=1 Tax=Radiomyces spectabilis TaxID=64574 RepID=UPI00221F5A36|nr:trafficking protein particle complex subunit 10 [Radiomyces spectabilis]KAI8372825.1 trafficking protein particle complex subunit 10 [Radiomyces spectabilis]
MSGRKVTVTYCDEYGVWPLIADDLSSRLPLKNLKWQPTNQRSERVIASLEVDLKRFNFDQPPQPLSHTQTNYLNLYFVACDDNEVYKNKVRRQIRAWTDVIGAKKNQEWMIVYVAGHDAKKSNNYLGLKTSVYDKIRTDFNQGKQDRCAYIRIRDPEGANSELWAGFIEKMKEHILASFDMQVLQIQEDTRRLDMQRHMPGWNYCTFFILKEGLAQAFEIMTLYEDALIQYDELEASFFQVLRDKALAWFGHFGGTDAGDDSGNILDFKRKDYRDLINKNIISVFDFRSYLFARQCRMLLKLHRVIEVCARAQLFITGFIPSIRDNRAHLTDNFLESWVFSACINVVNECEPLSVQIAAADPPFLIPYNAVKADLLLTARRQLDKLGLKYHHLPNTPPFSIYTTSENEEPSSPPSITNPKLLEAVDSLEAFDKIYMGLSTRAIKSYDASYRPRAALNVHGDIAALKYVREKYDEAVRIFDSMIWRYGEQDWSAIENTLLVKCADSQKRLGKTDQYLGSVLALLKNATYLSSEDAIHYTDELLANVQQLDTDILRPFSPMFKISVVSIIDDESLVDSTSVEIRVVNNLPKDLPIDRLSLRLVGNAPEQIWFTVENQVLKPGPNTFYLTSLTSTSGNYVVENCEMQTGRLIFGHNFMKPGQKKRVVRLNRDPKQLSAVIEQPNDVRLGVQQRFCVKIKIGERSISNGKVLLESQTEGLDIVKTGKVVAVIKDSSDHTTTKELERTESGETLLPECAPHQLLELSVPYEGPYTEFEYRVKTTITYTADSKELQFVSADPVRVTVPLVVTESSVFREDCVFLKVELSCNGDLPVRILETGLWPSKDYAIESASDSAQWDLTIFPKQIATFVYKLVKRVDNSDEDTEKLEPKVHFYAKYRTLRDEVETSIAAMLQQSLKEHKLGQHFPYVFSRVREAFLSSVDYASYGLTDVVHLDDFDAELCESFLLHRDLKTKVELLDLIEDFFEKHEAITMNTVNAFSPAPHIDCIVFPLEVPTSKILHKAELIITNGKDLRVSEACPCILRIERSTYWNSGSNDTAQDFFYDIDVDYDNWLLSGKRRLRFSSTPGEVMEFAVNLVPLKTGNLLLPTVRVSSVSPDGFAATVYTNSGQQILVKPKSKTATFFVEQQQRFLQPQMMPSFVSSPDRPSPSSPHIPSNRNIPKQEVV